jgi:hypothetical protein
VADILSLEAITRDERLAVTKSRGGELDVRRRGINVVVKT